MYNQYKVMDAIKSNRLENECCFCLGAFDEAGLITENDLDINQVPVVIETGGCGCKVHLRVTCISCLIRYRRSLDSGYIGPRCSSCRKPYHIDMDSLMGKGRLA